MDQTEGQSSKKNSPNYSETPRHHRIKESTKEQFFHQRSESNGKGYGEIGVERPGKELIERRFLRHGEKFSQEVEPEHENAHAHHADSGDPRPIPANRRPETRVIFPHNHQDHIKRYDHVGE